MIAYHHLASRHL